MPRLGDHLLSSPPVAELEQPPRRRWARVLLPPLLIALLGLAFVGLWTWRIAVQDLPAIPPTADLWTLNRPADVVFVDKTGLWLGERPGHRGERLDPAALPPYVASAFMADGAGQAPALGRKLARTLFASEPGTLQETALTWRLERRLSEPTLFALYLDRAAFGAGAYGLEAAAQTYFGKSAGRVTLSEAAFLAALADGPMQDATDAAMRTETVLDRMRRAATITQAAFDAARATPLKLSPSSMEEPEVSAVLDFAADDARARSPKTVGALVVTLSLAPDLQREAIRALRNAGAADAVITAVTETGEAAALAASLDHRFEPVGRLLKQRPLGEAALPVAQAAALEAGLSREAVAATPLDQLLSQVGGAKVDDLAKRLGLALGPMGPSANPLEFAAALQAFRDNGRLARPALITRIADGKGKILYARAENTTSEVYAPALSRQMTAMMRSSIQSTDLGRSAAGAGGPAGDGADGWFAGFTPELSAAVWTRNGAGAKDLWLGFMGAAHQGRPIRPLDTAADPGSPRGRFYTSLADDLDRLGAEAVGQNAQP